MDKQSEVQSQFRNQQNKLTYYLIALCVTCIGFSVYKTSGKALHISQIPLGIAVASWGISIFTAIRSLQYILSTLYSNNALFDIANGVDSLSGNHLEKQQLGIKVVTEGLEENARKATLFSKWQTRLFYLGMLSFISWHIIEMYITQINPSS